MLMVSLLALLQLLPSLFQLLYQLPSLFQLLFQLPSLFQLLFQLLFQQPVGHSAQSWLPASGPEAWQ